MNWLTFQIVSSKEFVFFRPVVVFFMALYIYCRTRLEVQADAAYVDLRSRCPYFYEFGCKFEPLVTDRTLGILLSTAFKIRYKEALTKVYTAAHITASKYLSFLTKEETNLYEAAHLSSTAFKKWKTGGRRLERASILGRKRKDSN
ncbi:PREDICTED: uncharacterized protein LOC104698786 [Camelina sativa]|uniref:Uncharacterized protein LOC104698786 n=1 Tax=Camelina sativa TaxID=90675 RepID=A0ABM0SKI8_CAMSA|nr:PREDICTED: uncharacterized protein LOC104698786 [Camelina sativa]